MKKIFKLISLSLLVFIVALVAVITINRGRITSTPLNEKYIAHAGGILDGHTYTNTIDAMQQSIDLGYRAIEIDFIITSDNQLIAGHDWLNFNAHTGFAHKTDSTTTFQEAKSRYFLGYKVAGADDIAQLFEQYPNVILVTDKVDDYRLLDKYFSNLKERMLVEAFSRQRYIELKEHGYTPMLSNGCSIRQTLHPELLLNGGVEWIASSHIIPTFNQWFLSNVLGIKLALFTINDIERCQELNKYANLIYTDSLLHSNLE